jgi:hypothetical protein
MKCPYCGKNLVIESYHPDSTNSNGLPPNWYTLGPYSGGYCVNCLGVYAHAYFLQLGNGSVYRYLTGANYDGGWKKICNFVKKRKVSSNFIGGRVTFQ